MATHARQQYFADESSLSKEKREFSIAEEVQQKIDSIEEGAQVNTIETIKVNGSEVQPDENKAVDLTIPGVVDSLDSTSSTDALSARQGKVLYDYIQDVSHIGHFLALWDASTGLPVTDPETSPYIYNTGDFYTVSNVAAAGGTNYKPDGTQYVIGQASTTVDTDNVAVNDFYFYDGATWRHMKNSGAGSIAVDGSLSTTSTNPVENRVITNALNGKADIADTNTKTFYLSSDSDLTTAQAAYDWYLAGKNPLLHLSYDSGGEFYVCFGLQGFNLDFVKPSLEGDFTSGGRTYLTKPGLSINANSSSQVTGITVWPKNRTVGRFLDTDTNYSTPYTPQYPGSPATKKYVDDHAGVTYTAGANVQISAQNVISATDTKAEWGNITGTLSNQTDLQNALNTKADNVDVNTKTFYLSSTSDLTNAQAAYDWWKSGKEAIIYYDNRTYTFERQTTASFDDPSYSGPILSFNYTRGPVLPYDSRLGTASPLSAAGATLYLGYSNDVVSIIIDSGVDYSSILPCDSTTPIVYSPYYNWDPATKKYVDDNVVQKSATMPSNPSEGMLWYDTANDKLKVYDGTNWNVVGDDAADINTKTFTLPSSLSSQDAITVAQEAFDWYMDGKTPIIRRVNDFNVYMCVGKNQSGLISPISYWLEFHNVRIGDGTVELGDYHMPSSAVDAIIRFTYDVNTNEVTQVESIYNQQDFLPTNSTTQVQYTPTRNRDPATKKYVDDNVVQKSAIAPSSPTEGMVWYDTTNDKLKVYDGTNWNEVGKEYTAGTGISVANNVISNIGVTSVNGQTGAVTVEEGDSKVFTISDLTSAASLATAQAAYDYALTGKCAIIKYSTGFFYVVFAGDASAMFGRAYGNGAVSSGTWAYWRALKLTVSNGSVTAIADNSNQINVQSSAPSSSTPNSTITLVI